MKRALTQLFSLPRRAKQSVLMLADFACLPLLFWAALALRYDHTDFPVLPGVPFGLPLVGALGVTALTFGGVYRAVVRAFDEKFLQDLVWSVVLIVVALFAGATAHVLPMPRSVPFIFGFLTFLWIWGSRSMIRSMVRVAVRINSPVKRVAIYGAGAAGRQILSVLRAAPEYFPIAFLDDSPGFVGTRVQGLRVYGSGELAKLNAAYDLDEILLAMPSASRAERRAIIERLEPMNLRVRMVPGLDQMVGGEASVSDIREVDITDLLGRDPVPPRRDLFDRNIAGKRVLVTGAGGSIGSELCRQVLAQKPERLILVELSEFALYQIDQELRLLAPDAIIVPVLCSALNEARLKQLMLEHGVQTVYHAAAYKHVPIVEHNPFEGITNNTMGTYRAARAAIAAKVETFVLISTDKAVRPTNVMGASKRLAEMVLQALAAERTHQTCFCMVRFGNVLGSSGSVVPLFRAQIAKGGPVTVTHPEVTRFFMTIPEAAQLVIQAGAMGQGGDLFVLDMGESVKIVSLARKMIRLSGMSVRENDGPGDIAIAFTGLRPGEKLYEELLIGNNVSKTDHERILRAMESFVPLQALESFFEAVPRLASNFDVDGLKLTLSRLIEGFEPNAPLTSMPPEQPPARADAVFGAEPVDLLPIQLALGVQSAQR